MIEEPTHVEPSRPLADETLSTNGSHQPILGGHTRVGRPMIVGAISIAALLAFIPSWIQKWLWMRQLGYSGVFWTLLSDRWELFCVAFVVALLYLAVNLRLAARNGATFHAGTLTSESMLAAKFGIQVSPTVLKLAIGTIAAVAALIFALIFYAQWDTYLRSRYGGSFGLSHPLFGAMLGFICSVSPFMRFCRGAWPHWR